MKNEDLKSAPSNQWPCSIFWLIPLMLVCGVFLVVDAFVLINWALPDEDARLLKNLFALTIGGSTGGAALSGAIGFVQRSLRLTEAKVQAIYLDQRDEATRITERPYDQAVVTVGQLSTNQDSLGDDIWNDESLRTDVLDLDEVEFD